MYFTIKDEEAVLKTVMFAGNNRFLKFIPKNGTKVLVRGAVSVYESGGQYQLIAREMQPDGMGSLYLAFEQLKQKLHEEGLFDPQRKRGLPLYPKTIGVVTSPTGAAVRDIITTIRRRYPIARIILVPVVVQGENAPHAISRAIELMNRSNEVDVMIVGRGGGSIEELWAFNSEAVARSIFVSMIPVISAVGHETDFTIADFVADVRAATPTAAAELAVPHIQELRQRISWLQEKLQGQLVARKNQAGESWRRAHKALMHRHPQKQAENANQRLDRLMDRFYLAMHRFTRNRRVQMNGTIQRLQYFNPSKQVDVFRERLDRLQHDLHKEANQALNQKRNQLLLTMARLDGLSPLKIMSRGYSLVYKDGQLVKSIQQLDPGDGVRVELRDGSIDCSIWALEERKNHGKD